MSDKTNVKTFQAVVDLIKAARDAEMASINVQLEALAIPSAATHNVRLLFGGSNDAYYLNLVKRPAGNTAAQALAVAQAAEMAQAALAPYAAVPDAGRGNACCTRRRGDGDGAPGVVTAGQTVQIEWPASGR